MAAPRGRRSGLRREWLILLMLTGVAALLLGSANGLGAADHFIYDQLMRADHRAAPDNIAIVAIDDASIARLGRWPWTRGTHAQLLNVLSSGRPKAVGLDIILTENQTDRDGAGNDTAAGDRALAAAVARNGHTVLPVVMVQSGTRLQALLPAPALAAAAAQLAHIHLNFDDDSIVRSVYLQESLDGQRWNNLSPAMLETGGDAPDLGRIRTAPDNSPSALQAGLVRDVLMRIPYAGAPGHFPAVSYADVLQGIVPPQFFRDKYVLVGATAIGLGDAFPTPLSTRYGLMSGVEMHANILASLLQGRAIVQSSTTVTILFTALPALLVLMACLYLSLRQALLCTVAALAAVAVGCYAAFVNDIWIPPCAALLLLLLVYPLWSWRRLEAALRYLNEEYIRLSAVAPFTSPADSAAAVQRSGRKWDFLERRIEAMQLATRRLSDLHQFVSDNLNSMPDANLVIDGNGILMLHNRKAHDLFAPLVAQRPAVAARMPARGMHIDDLMACFAWPNSIKKPDFPGLHAQAGSIEARISRDPLDRIFVIRSAPSQKANGDALGWIVTLADVTAMRAAEKFRDDSLNFISHDMRAPQSSILALLELQRNDRQALQQDELFGRIEKSVRSTLSLADDFVHLARAKSTAYRFEECDFAFILADAADEMWGLANGKGITVTIDAEDTDQGYWVSADRALMTRALCNLLSNAIKFGPAGSRVECRVYALAATTPAAAATLCCEIRDQGQGIGVADSSLLFTPFYRTGSTQQPGAGLGLAFVGTVMQQHGGTVSLVNAGTPGACFLLCLPAAGTTAPDDGYSSLSSR